MIEVSKIKELLKKPVSYYTKENRDAGFSLLAYAKKTNEGKHLRNGCSDCIAKAYYVLKKYENMKDGKILGGSEFLLNDHYNKCGFREFGKTKFYRNNTTSVEERKALYESLSEGKRVNIFDLSTCSNISIEKKEEEAKPKRVRKPKNG